jgi:hypothetical protein
MQMMFQTTETEADTKADLENAMGNLFPHLDLADTVARLIKKGNLVKAKVLLEENGYNDAGQQVDDFAEFLGVSSTKIVRWQ